MALDLLFAFWIIATGLLGLRDGSVRKLVALLMTGIALIVGQVMMRSAASLLIELFAIDPSSAPMLGFLFVFVGIVVVQSIVYKVVTESFKIGGLADRVGGATIGVFQGMLFLSSLLYILAFVGVPSQSFRQYSKIYKSVVNIAPQVLDLFTTVQGQSMDDLQEIAKEKGLEKLRGMVKSGEAVADSVRENRYLDQVEKEKGARVRQLDSLKSAVRR